MTFSTTTSNIYQIIKLYHQLHKYNDEKATDNFLQKYGQAKISKILKVYGFMRYGVAQNFEGNVYNQISANVVSKTLKKPVSFCRLYSVYKVSEKQQGDVGFFDNDARQIVFDCLLINKCVNIKKNYSLAEIKQLIESQRLILIGVKESQIKNNNFFNRNLIEVDRSYIANFGDNFLQKNILQILEFKSDVLPSLFCTKRNVQIDTLKLEQIKCKKEILKKLLVYELQTEQLKIADNLDEMKSKITKVASSYQTNAEQLSSKLSLNGQLLSVLEC